jgi:3-dehydroquinate synthase
MEIKEIKYNSKVSTLTFTDDYSENIEGADDSVLIIDSEVYRIYHPFNFRNQIILKVDEQHKILSTVEEIYSKLIEFGATKQTKLFGIGGGITCDITGFTASTYMRGMKFSLIPTTLLAQADASIGGKNGLNFHNIKNMIGCINQPDEIIIDTRFLNSLNEQYVSTGFSEIIKIAFICDKELYYMLDELDTKELNFLSNNFKKILKRSIENKIRIVLNDEFDAGERRILNFGHTIGHAIEAAYRIQHGNAVALGMVFSANLSERLGLIDVDAVEKLIALLKKFKLPTNEPIDPKSLVDYFKQDKKRESSLVNFILLDSIGKANVKKIKIDLIEKAVYDMYKY